MKWQRQFNGKWIQQCKRTLSIQDWRLQYMVYFVELWTAISYLFSVRTSENRLRNFLRQIIPFLFLLSIKLCSQRWHLIFYKIHHIFCSLNVDMHVFLHIIRYSSILFNLVYYWYYSRSHYFWRSIAYYYKNGFMFIVTGNFYYWNLLPNQNFASFTLFIISGYFQGPQV